MAKCKYCGYDGGEFPKDNVCYKCKKKLTQMRRFAEARDDLREKLGLERLGDE